ncbi:MAG: hypothetical protein ACOYNN_15145 [Terrimicrobiaceae bacterium]
MKLQTKKYFYQVDWFHPFSIVGYRDDGEMDGRNWGLDLDLRTVLNVCHYEYGWIFACRVLGFGFEFSRLDFA